MAESAANPVQSAIRAMMARAHERPEAEFDHQSLEAATLVQQSRLPIKEISRVWPIGRHSVVEYVRERDGATEIAYAALAAL